MPSYMMKARTVLLSKEENNRYPAFGKCRVLAVLSILTKLFEMCLLIKLRAEINLKAKISEKQRGFQPGCSTIQNVSDVFGMIEKTQVKMRELMKQKVLVKKRPKSFLLFTDMTVAFDTIQRHQLYDQLRSKGIDGNLVETIREMLSMAKLSDGINETSTTIGSL